MKQKIALVVASFAAILVYADPLCPGDLIHSCNQSSTITTFFCCSTKKTGCCAYVCSKKLCDGVVVVDQIAGGFYSGKICDGQGECAYL